MNKKLYLDGKCNWTRRLWTKGDQQKWISQNKQKHAAEHVAILTEHYVTYTIMTLAARSFAWRFLHPVRCKCDARWRNRIPNVGQINKKKHVHAHYGSSRTRSRSESASDRRLRRSKRVDCHFKCGRRSGRTADNYVMNWEVNVLGE